MAFGARYERRVDATNEGFALQTYRAIVHASAIQEKYVVIRGVSLPFVHDDSVLIKAIAPKHVECTQSRQCHAFDEFLDDPLFTPIGFPSASGNGFEFPVSGDHLRVPEVQMTT